MGADSTLVNAAFKEAVSRAGANVPSMQSLFDSNKEQSKASLNMITKAIAARDAINEKSRLGKEKQLKRFKDICARNYEKLFVGKETMPQKVIDAVDKRIRELQDEFEMVNTYGKNDTVENERARMRLNGELQRIINAAVNTRATFGKLGENLDSWNHDEISADIIAPQTMMMDLDNIDTNDNVTIEFNDKNELTFSAENYYGDATSTWGNKVSYTIAQMEKNIPKKNVKADANVLKGNKSAKDKGRTDGFDDDGGMDFDVQVEKDNFLADIKTEEDFQNIARRRLEGLESTLSFKEALEKNIDIPVAVLNNMFVNMDGEMVDVGSVYAELDRSGPDGNPDGIINAEDSVGLEGKDLEAFIANHDAMIDILTNKDNESFDLKRSKSLIGDYYTDLKRQEYEKGFKYERGRKPLKAGEAWLGSYKSLPILGSNEYADYDTGVLMLESMRDAEKGNKTYFGLKGDFFTYDPDTKLWSTSPDNVRWNFEKGATTTQLIVKLGLNASEFQAMKGELPPPGGFPLTLYQNEKIDHTMFGKKYDEVLNKILVSGKLFSNITFTNVPGKVYGNKDKINVETTDSNNSIILDFSLKDADAQKAEMKKLNDFLEEYSK